MITACRTGDSMTAEPIRFRENHEGAIILKAPILSCGASTTVALKNAGTRIPRHRRLETTLEPAKPLSLITGPLRVVRRDLWGCPTHDRRSLVQERRALLPLGRYLHGCQWRRGRRLQGAFTSTGLSAGARHHRDLADAVPAVARQG